MERLLTQWAEKGLFRADAAEAYLQRQRALQMEMIELLRLAGSDRTPGYSDIALFEGWRARFSPEMLRLAAEQSRGKGAAVGAIDKLLPRGRRRAFQRPNRRRARRERPAEKKAFDNPALRYEQRTLAGDGDELFTDLTQYRGDGE